MKIKWPAWIHLRQQPLLGVRLCHYAPSYSGLIQGIAGTGIGTVPPDAILTPKQ